MTLDSLHSEDTKTSNGHKAKSILARILSAKDIASSIPLLIKELKELWECKAITIFALDRDNRQLFSRNKVIDSAIRNSSKHFHQQSCRLLSSSR
jgi:hypothetical protein